MPIDQTKPRYIALVRKDGGPFELHKNGELISPVDAFLLTRQFEVALALPVKAVLSVAVEETSKVDAETPPPAPVKTDAPPAK